MNGDEKRKEASHVKRTDCKNCLVGHFYTIFFLRLEEEELPPRPPPPTFLGDLPLVFLLAEKRN